MDKKKVYKIISLSSTSADLSGLYSKYCYKFDSINPLESPYQIGIDYYSKDIQLLSGEVLTFHFWKLYFQARFNFFLEKLVKDADGGLLMFDLTSKVSLYNIEMYIRIFRTHDPDLPIILIGDKADLMGMRAYNQEYIEQYISKNKITLYFEVFSEKDDNTHIEEMYYRIARLVFERVN